MPYIKPYSLPWLEFSADKARTDAEAGKDPRAVLESLIFDVSGFIENNRKKATRNVSEEVRRARAERMKEMRANGIGGRPKGVKETRHRSTFGVARNGVGDV